MDDKAQARLPVLYSGVQPSGQIHLGNYVGAIRNFKALEDEYHCLICVVDLHAITLRQVPAELRRQTLELAALYIACGLDPKKSIIYCQSHVPQHAEMSWILNCFTYMGELSRMTQFKEKAQRHRDNINAGLFTYPTLMAADILLYQAAVVPVGSDQKQHLELTRDIAQRFNALYGDVFTIPEPYIPKETARIMSLADPERKMSKSDEDPNSTISLLDSPDQVRRKFKRAVTDSLGEIVYDPEKRPGVSNLLAILSGMTGESPQAAQERLAGKGYGQLKEEVAQAVIEALAPIQAEFGRLIKDKAYLGNVLKENAQSAQALAERTLRKAQKKIGFYQLP